MGKHFDGVHTKEKEVSPRRATDSEETSNSAKNGRSPSSLTPIRLGSSFGQIRFHTSCLFPPPPPFRFHHLVCPTWGNRSPCDFMLTKQIRVEFELGNFPWRLISLGAEGLKRNGKQFCCSKKQKRGVWKNMHKLQKVNASMYLSQPCDSFYHIPSCTRTSVGARFQIRHKESAIAGLQAHSPDDKCSPNLKKTCMFKWTYELTNMPVSWNSSLSSLLNCHLSKSYWSRSYLP